MGFIVDSTPIKTVKGILSNVSAGRSQLPFEFTREDYTGIVLVQWNVNDIQIQIPKDGIIDNIEDGDSIYIFFNDEVNYPNQDGIYTVETVSDGGTFMRVFILSGNYNGNISTLSVNGLSAFPNYKLEIQVTNELTQESIFYSPLLFRFDENQKLFIDIHEMFFGFQFPDYYYRIKVHYNEINGQGQSGSSGEILAVLGHKQALDNGGANMFDYLPVTQDAFNFIRVDLAGDGTDQPIIVFDNSGPNHPFSTGEFVEVVDGLYKGVHEITNISNTSLEKWIKLDARFLGPITGGSGNNIGVVKRPSGKFLTDNTNQVCHQYWKKTVSFVVDSNLTAREGIASVDILTIGRNKAGSTIFSDFTTYSPTGVYEHEIPTIKDVDNWQILLTDTATKTTLLSEVLEFKQDCLPRNPMMLEWQNRRGAMEQYVFGVNQVINQRVKEGLTFERSVTQDIATVQSIAGQIPIGNNQNITLTAENVPLDLVRSLRFIKNSPEIYLYLDQNQNKRIQVVVVDNFDTPISTNTQRADFNCVVRLSNNFEIDG